MKLLSVLVLVLVGQSALARTVVCNSNVIYVDAAGASEAKATLQFIPNLDPADGLPILSNFQGRIIYPEYLVKTLAEAGDDIADAKYKIKTVKSNPNYKPIKYKGYVQFNVSKTTNDVMDLYGIHLLIPHGAFKATSPFQAVVLFDMDQNGARMILNCK